MKKKKKTESKFFTHSFTISVYGAVVSLYVGEHKKFMKKVSKKFTKLDIQDEGNFGEFHAFFQPDSGFKGIVIWLPFWEGSPEDYGVLSHECFHATMHLAHECSLSFSPDADEALAYLHQNIFTDCVTALKNVRIKQ